MNKPLPWNIKGVGFDSRETARLAAKRAGQPVGEWLNDVIATRAAELGLSIDDIEADDRLESIAARLSVGDNLASGTPRGAGRPPPPPGLFDQDASASRGRDGRRGGQRPRPQFDSSLTGEGDRRETSPAGARLVGTSRPEASDRSAITSSWGGRAAADQGVALASRARADVGAIRRASPPRAAAPAKAVASPVKPGGSVSTTNLDMKLNAVLDKLNRSFEEAERFGEAAAATLTKSPAVEEPAREPAATRLDRSARRSVETRPLETRPLRDEAPAPRAPAEPTALSAAAVSPAPMLAPNPDHDARAGAAPVPAPRPTKALDPAASGRLANETMQLQEAIALLCERLADMTPEKTVMALESAVQGLGDRVDLSRLDGVASSILGPVEQLGKDIREAIRAADPTVLVQDLGHDLQALRDRVETLDARPSANAVKEMRAEIGDVRATLDAAAKRIALSERLQNEISALSARIDLLTERVNPLALDQIGTAVGDIRGLMQTFGAEGLIGSLDRRVAAMATQVEAISQRPAPVSFNDISREIDRAHQALLVRLAEQPDAGGFTRIEDRLGVLSEKVDAVGRSSEEAKVVVGLVTALTARIEEARHAEAAAPALAALQSEVGRLVERFEQSQTTLSSLGSIEKLIGDLFGQIEQSRTAAVDAAQAAARTAAQDTIRVALDNPALNGGELALQTGLDVNQVSLELADLRQIHEASESRVNATLTALNSTLERLVDRMVADPLGRPRAVAVEAALPAPMIETHEAPEVPLPVAASPAETDFSDAASTSPAFDPEHFLLEPGATPAPPAAVPAGKVAAADLTAEAPIVDPVRRDATEEAGSVGSLIAAARRAAQMAQASAIEAVRKDAVSGDGAAADAGKVRSFFARRRRPLLLSLAGLVLLVGTLQVVRLSTNQLGLSETAPATAVASHDEATGPDSQRTADAAAPTVAATQPATAPLPSTDASAGKDVKPAASPAQSLSAALPAGIAPGLRDLASGGNAAAEYEVGARLSEGRGVPRDPKQAADWFDLAAQQGLAPAQYRLASSYEKGSGRTADPALATSWYEKAAVGGNIRAMHNLAVMLADGAGTKPDYGKAISWFTKAAAAGVRDSQFNLAVLYARGLGTSQDFSQSYTWFSLAALQGDADAAKKRDAVAAKLDSRTLADAKSTVIGFKPTAANPAANDVAPPSGGWEGATDKTAGRKPDPVVGNL